jgi:ABC-type Fe3+/spermidine/putrescine transport system ATPase subunit
MNVTLDAVSKRFGDTLAVDRVSAEIETGTLFFLLGPSGCGKTTLLRMLAGFSDPDSGSIRFGNRPMNGAPPQDRNTALIFQNYALWPHLTVFENVAYGLRLRHVPPAELRERVLRLLERVKLADYRERKPATLSGGQQQRVALARALVVRPDLLLFDEPLCNLDSKLRIAMRDEIRNLHAEEKLTAVYVTHDQEEALSLASRIAVMRDGHIEQIGHPHEIYTRPANPFVASFIGEINWVTPASPLARITGQPQDKACGFRPENVAVADAVLDPREGWCPAHVIHSTYLGSKNQLLLRLADNSEIKAWVTGYHPEGTSVSCRIIPDHWLLF